MNKTEILTYLRTAKKAHIRWKSYAQAIHMGLPLDDSATPIILTECEFGEWYYGKGQELNHLETFRNIDKPHQDIHDIYMKMYQVKNEKIEVGLFGSKSKKLKEQKDHLENLMQRMLNISTDLLAKIVLLEEEIGKRNENCKIEEHKKIKTDSTKTAKAEVKRVVKTDGSSLKSDLSNLLND